MKVRRLLSKLSLKPKNLKGIFNYFTIRLSSCEEFSIIDYVRVEFNGSSTHLPHQHLYYDLEEGFIIFLTPIHIITYADNPVFSVQIKLKLLTIANLAKRLSFKSDSINSQLKSNEDFILLYEEKNSKILANAHFSYEVMSQFKNGSLSLVSIDQEIKDVPPASNSSSTQERSPISPNSLSEDFLESKQRTLRRSQSLFNVYQTLRKDLVHQKKVKVLRETNQTLRQKVFLHSKSVHKRSIYLKRLTTSFLSSFSPNKLLLPSRLNGEASRDHLFGQLGFLEKVKESFQDLVCTGKTLRTKAMVMQKASDKSKEAIEKVQVLSRTSTEMVEKKTFNNLAETINRMKKSINELKRKNGGLYGNGVEIKISLRRPIFKYCIELVKETAERLLVCLNKSKKVFRLQKKILNMNSFCLNLFSKEVDGRAVSSALNILIKNVLSLDGRNKLEIFSIVKRIKLLQSELFVLYSGVSELSCIRDSMVLNLHRSSFN